MSDAENLATDVFAHRNGYPAFAGVAGSRPEWRPPKQSHIRVSGGLEADQFPQSPGSDVPAGELRRAVQVRHPVAASNLRRAVVQTEGCRVRMGTNRLAKTSDEPQLHSSRQRRSYHIYIILSEKGFHLCGIPSIPVRHPGQRWQRLFNQTSWLTQANELSGSRAGILETMGNPARHEDACAGGHRMAPAIYFKQELPFANKEPFFEVMVDMQWHTKLG